MGRTLFPDLEKLSAADLIGLKILEVNSSLSDAVRFIRCIDERGELHEITFRLVDSSYVALKLDDHEVLNIRTGE